MSRILETSEDMNIDGKALYNWHLWIRLYLQYRKKTGNKNGHNGLIREMLLGRGGGRGWSTDYPSIDDVTGRSLLTVMQSRSIRLILYKKTNQPWLLKDIFLICFCNDF